MSTIARDRPPPPATVMLRGSAGLVIEPALQALLRVRSGPEMARAVTDGVRSTVSASWVALVADPREAPRVLACSGSEGLPAAAMGTLGGVRIPADGELRDLSGEAGGAFLAAGLRRGGEERCLLLVGPQDTREVYNPEERTLLRRLLEPCSVALENAAELDRLSSLVFVDPLTGCYNRRGFDDHLNVEVIRAERYRRSVSLLLLDVDHFKDVNDRYGHPAGDHALRRVGELLLEIFRSTDVVCRFGGDEFAVIFPETAKAEVARPAERLRARIASLFPDEALPTGVTASLGIAGFPGDAAGPDSLLLAADQALYRAKAAGRNRVDAT